LTFASTQSLVDACEAGDPQAWRELHQRYRPVVIMFLRHLGVPTPEIDDACQEVFVQVFRYLTRFERRSDPRTWIYRLCLTQASRLRRRARLTRALGWFLRARPIVQPAGPWMDWSDDELHRRLAAALERLKPIHRDVFVLYELEGLSGEEVAEVTGLPFSTVRRRLHHARREFEAAIGGREGGNP
jgi:RNA polymerase sigma-70 factor, ECF subfamily